MSLDWDATAVVNYDALIEEERGTVLLDAAIFMCLSVGIGSITKKTYKEWYRRVWLVEAVQGAMRKNGDGTDTYFTEAEAYRLVGLKTNAGMMNRNKFTAFVKDLALNHAITIRARTRREVEPQ
jgi:hypothetical protein